VKRWYIITISAFIFIGCATGPYGRDFKSYYNGPVFEKPIEGIITVDDQSGYKKGTLNYREMPKEEIIKDIRWDQKSFNEDVSKGVEYHFIYHKCEEQGLFPTKYSPLNLLIGIGTLGFWPIGVNYKCRVDLEVKYIPSGHVLNTYTSETDEVMGGSFLWNYIHLNSISDGSWRLPARRLLQRHQMSTRCEQSTSR